MDSWLEFMALFAAVVVAGGIVATIVAFLARCKKDKPAYVHGIRVEPVRGLTIARFGELIHSSSVVIKLASGDSMTIPMDTIPHRILAFMDDDGSLRSEWLMLQHPIPCSQVTGWGANKEIVRAIEVLTNPSTRDVFFVSEFEGSEDDKA